VILTKCSANARSTAWKLTNNLWKKRSNSPLPEDIGKVLGCDLAQFKTNNVINKGKTRLYQILVSETAHLIWKLRNKRRIRDQDSQTNISDEEIKTRWTNAINKRLTTDQFLTDNKRFEKKAIETKLVKATWTNCLRDKESLPNNWQENTGVLVGILRPVPSGIG
jgi:hypothetical protein